jgi:hypothetical protein
MTYQTLSEDQIKENKKLFVDFVRKLHRIKQRKTPDMELMGEWYHLCSDQLVLLEKCDFNILGSRMSKKEFIGFFDEFVSQVNQLRLEKHEKEKLINENLKAKKEKEDYQKYLKSATLPGERMLLGQTKETKMLKAGDRALMIAELMKEFGIKAESIMGKNRIEEMRIRSEWSEKFEWFCKVLTDEELINKDLRKLRDISEDALKMFKN